jgi:transcriptional regulator with XRE-family HTH domain
MTKDEWKDIFGDNLSDILKEKKMTQLELSKVSGVSTGVISDYINKWTAPGLLAGINSARALDMSLEELIDFDDDIEL